MATIIKLKSDIKKLKGALTSKGLSASIKSKLKAQLTKAQNELTSMQKGGGARKVSTTKGTQSALAKLKAMVKKKKYGIYKGAGVDLKKDSEEPALAIGRRVSKGLKGNQFSSKKSSKGHVYYEYRANRLDVKQPSKTARYPKLAKGGEVDEDYKKKLSNHIYKTSLNKNVNGFKLVKESWNNIGALLWINKQIPELEIYATPFFTPDNDINFEEFVNDEISRREDKAYKLTNDLDKDTQTYFDYVESKTKKYAKMEHGGYMADGGEVDEYEDDDDFEDNLRLPNRDNLYALMEVEKESGYGSLVDGQVYTHKEANLKKSELIDKIDGKYEIKIFTVNGLLSRKSLPKNSKERILNSYKEKIKLIQNLNERFPNYNWEEDFKKGGKVNEPMVVRGYFEDEAYEYAKGGMTPKENLEKELHKLLRDLNSTRLSTYREGDTSEEELARQKERKIKLARFEEVKKVLNEIDSKYAEGGITEKEVVESNNEMVLSQIKAVKHHADELSHIVSSKRNIEAWVVGKIERASTDLSDITHYLAGQHQKMSMGGSVYNHMHKMDKK